jgi:hypothetical protein
LQQQQIHLKARWQEAIIVIATVAKAIIIGEVLRQVLPPEGKAKFQADLLLEKTNDAIEQHKEPCQPTSPS